MAENKVARNHSERFCIMTKRELLDVLASVPDDAEVFIMGADVGIVVHSPEGNYVTLDEEAYPFEDGVRNGYRVLFDPLGQLADEVAVGARRDMRTRNINPIDRKSVV